MRFLVISTLPEKNFPALEAILYPVLLQTKAQVVEAIASGEQRGSSQLPGNSANGLLTSEEGLALDGMLVNNLSNCLSKSTALLINR